MDKPEDKKPVPPAGGPPRPPIGGKKPDGLSKGPVPSGPVPPRPAGSSLPKLPLPGQKPGGAPARPGGFPTIPNPGLPGAGAPGAARPPMPGMPGRPGAPMAPQPPLNPAVEKNLSEAEGAKTELQGKIAELEKKLMEEREKVLLASLRSKEEEAVSAKVETSIKDIQDKLRREKKDQEMEEARRKAESRALDMERRLAEEREAWVQTLKNQLNQRDTITQEMETHFSSRLKDLEYRWSQEKSNLESSLKERESELIRVRQETGLKGEQERGFWEDRLRVMTLEKEKMERELERLRDKAQQEKDQLSAERQTLRDQVARLESTARMLEDQHRIERSNISREFETTVNGLKQQLTMDKDQAEKQISALNHQVQGQSREAMEKAGQVEALKSQVASHNLQTEQFTARLGDRERVIDNLKGKIQDAENERQKLQSALDHAAIHKKESEGALERVREEENRKLQDEIARVRNQYRDEIQKMQLDFDSKFKSIQSRLEPYELNASKAYAEAREKARSEVESNEKALLDERDSLKAQIEQVRSDGKEAQWGLESQIKALQDDVRSEKIRVQQVEEARQMLEQELKQRIENRAYDQALLEERNMEVDRLTKNVDTLRKAFESQKMKIPVLNKEIEDLKQMLHEKGLKTNDEFQMQLDEKTRELERAQQQLRSIKEVAQEAEKKEEIFKEKERVFRQMLEDKEGTSNEFKNRVHALERRIDEFGEEKERVKAEAAKEIDKIIRAKDRELEDRLAALKEEWNLSIQDQIEKAKFESAKETAEKVRAEMPAFSSNPDLIRQEVERDMMNQLREKEEQLEVRVKEVKDEAKKDLDKFRWETESLKEELKRAREARNQIEKEAQELLQQAEGHYKSQLEKKVTEVKGKAGKSKGIFTTIGKILDTPIIDFDKKKGGE